MLVDFQNSKFFDSKKMFNRLYNRKQKEKKTLG